MAFDLIFFGTFLLEICFSVFSFVPDFVREAGAQPIASKQASKPIVPTCHDQKPRPQPKCQRTTITDPDRTFGTEGADCAWKVLNHPHGTPDSPSPKRRLATAVLRRLESC